MYFFIDAANNGITDEGIVFILENQWPNLEVIHLSTNPFGEKGANEVLKQNWPNIRLVKMKRLNPISEELKQQLRGKFFPKAQLHIDP